MEDHFTRFLQFPVSSSFLYDSLFFVFQYVLPNYQHFFFYTKEIHLKYKIGNIVFKILNQLLQKFHSNRDKEPFFLQSNVENAMLKMIVESLNQCSETILEFILSTLDVDVNHSVL